MVGYIEDLDLINVSDILNDVSLNSSVPPLPQPTNASSSATVSNSTMMEHQRLGMRPDFQNYKNQQEYENIERFASVDTLRVPNPVGYLQELCVKKGFTTPVYGILKQEGPSHEPVFTTFCQVEQYYRVATSKSKKQGKEIAAREVITCLKKAIDFESKNRSELPITSETVGNVTSEVSTENPSEIPKPARTMNYVGFLQELCVRKQLPPPNYGTEKSTGTPNNPSFYIFCEVGQHREVGIGSNKKIAKQLAAEKVLGLLEMLKTKTDPSYKESAHAENYEILHTTINTKDIQVLSETALKAFSTIPNPVGHLQELCVKYRLRPPVYEIVKVDGPPHCPTFLTSCKVEHLYQEASSSNKKKGKEIAASKILQCLMEHSKSASEWEKEGKEAG